MRRSKYRAVPTVVDGIRFDSKREAARYQELKMLELAGVIHRLKLQPVFELHANGGGPVGTYRADFEYCRCEQLSARCWSTDIVVEDVKGFDTPLSRWKRKHVKAQYLVNVQIVK